MSMSQQNRERGRHSGFCDDNYRLHGNEPFYDRVYHKTEHHANLSAQCDDDVFPFQVEGISLKNHRPRCNFYPAWDYVAMQKEDFDKLLEHVCSLQRSCEWHKTQFRAFEKQIHKIRHEKCEAKQLENEARTTSLRLRKDLEETKAAYLEEKKHFITTPDVARSLESLATEIRELKSAQLAQNEDRLEINKIDVENKQKLHMIMEKDFEARIGDRKTLKKMKRAIHDIRRQPQRRQGKEPRRSSDFTGSLNRRLCYKCRCKGHLAKDCPHTRQESKRTTKNDSSSKDEDKPKTTYISGIYSFVKKHVMGHDSEVDDG